MWLSACHNWNRYKGTRSACGLTLIELLVVVSIIGLLAGILLPALAKARRQARTVLGTNNQRQSVCSLTQYSLDRNDRYPESVATVGVVSGHWNWQDPRMLTAFEKRAPQLCRSIAEYLNEYITNAETMFCPNSPRRYAYIDQLWQAGDLWDNPETPLPWDPATGSYCFYWNYLGHLGPDALFRGPGGTAGRRGYSRLVMSDYLGYDHWRSRDAWGSCERVSPGSVTPETWLSAAYWSSPQQAVSDSRSVSGLSLNAGYTDGHVARFSPSETIAMQVGITSDATVPYPSGVGPGLFFLPRDSAY